MSSERGFTANPPGFVPFYGQGLQAKESQLGAIGTKEWLKSIKLHKYWPLISHWSYWQMLALTEDNIEYNIKIVGGTGITQGAKGKLLRSIEELRERKSKLKKIVEDLGSCGTSLEADLSYVMKTVFTPFPTSEEDSLPTLLVYSIQKMKEYIRLNENSTQHEKTSIEKITKSIKRNPVLYRAEEHLQSVPFLWEMHTTLTNYAVKSSRILPHILHQRKRNISVDSGFEENSKHLDSSRDGSSLWPVGTNTVMLQLPTGNEHQKLFVQSPFYPVEEKKREYCQ